MRQQIKVRGKLENCNKFCNKNLNTKSVLLPNKDLKARARNERRKKNPIFVTLRIKSDIKK